MNEIRNKFYTQRFYADSVNFSDLFWPVTYTNYCGDKNKIPFYYKRIYGHTIYIDLKQCLEDIINHIKSNTRNEIRRGLKENMEFKVHDDYNKFVPFYNAFSESKGLGDIINRSKLDKYDKAVITEINYNGMTLVMHATLVSKADKKACLLYSASIRLNDSVDKKYVGIANRFLHYKEFEYFKSMNLDIYDFGGLCIDENEPAKYNIGLFKRSFGGEIIDNIGLRSPLFVLLKKIGL